jgi:hypothetical protein
VIRCRRDFPEFRSLARGRTQIFTSGGIFMTTTTSKIARTLAVTAAAALIAACGGSGGDGDKTQTGRLKLSITDSPMEDVQSVWVQFSAVEFKPEGGAPILNTLATSQRLNLLELQAGRTAVLVNDVVLPAGRYEWIRLVVDNVPNVRDSYVMANDAECELTVPSGAESGLKMNRGFTLPADGSVALTVDFDLRKSLHAPPGQRSMMEKCTQGYLLRPTLRLVQDSTVGAIAGTVDVSRRPEGCARMVYVFEGDPATTFPDDYDNQDEEPVVMARVSDAGTYYASFLTAGTYTVAYTCSAEDAVTPSENDSDAEPPFVFDDDKQGATVQPNLITTVNFGPLAP